MEAPGPSGCILVATIRYIFRPQYAVFATSTVFKKTELNTDASQLFSTKYKGVQKEF
jgi:hypothetical protein